MKSSSAKLVILASAFLAISVTPACKKDKKDTTIPEETKFTDNPSNIVVSTVAGTTQGYQDGPGTSAQFNVPMGITIDAAGNIYVADWNRLRKIDKNNTVSTLAGNGVAGYVDGSGQTAQFHFEYSNLATDKNGNIVMTDGDNRRIRRITTGGQVTTIAGSITGYLDGPAATARFRYPFGVGIDASGNIIVADLNNDCIRKVSTDNVVSTIAGIADDPGFADGAALSARFIAPSGLTIDKDGNIYVVSNNRIRKIDKNGTVSSIGSGEIGYVDGAAGSAKFNNPVGVAADAEGNIIVADAGNGRIRKINPSGTVSTLAGTGTAGFLDGAGTSAQFDGLFALAVDANGDIYITDGGNHRIRKITGRK